MLKKLALVLAVLVLSANAALAAEKKIVFASDCTWPPMEFLDSNKQIVGFEIDLVKAVAKEAGFTPVFKNVAWDGIFAGLAAKKYDVVLSSVSITDERKKTMDFSEPYFEVKQALVVPKTSNVATVADLKGKTLGGQIGTTGVFAVKKIEGATLKTYDEIGLAMEDLLNGRIDGVSCDDPVAANYALQQEQYAAKLKIAFIIPADEKEFYGMALRKGNKEVLDLLNKGIKAVQAKGIDKELRAKWIGQ